MRTEQHGLQNYSSHDANSLNDIKLENLDSRIVNIDSRTNTKLQQRNQDCSSVTCRKQDALVSRDSSKIEAVRGRGFLRSSRGRFNLPRGRLHPRPCHRYITREACLQARDESRPRPKIPRCSRFEEKTDCPFLARYKSDARRMRGERREGEGRRDSRSLDKSRAPLDHPTGAIKKSSLLALIIIGPPMNPFRNASCVARQVNTCGRKSRKTIFRILNCEWSFRKRELFIGDSYGSICVCWKLSIEIQRYWFKFNYLIKSIFVNRDWLIVYLN